MTNLQEIWKEIPYLKGRYEASTFGRIRNTRTGHILKTSVHRYKSKKYLRFTTAESRYLTYHIVHRVILDTFKPRLDSINLTVHHKDFDTFNNHVDNLEWLPQIDNNNKSRLSGRYLEKDKKHSEYLKNATQQGKNWLVNYNTGRKGSLSNSAKLKNDDIPKIRELRQQGITLTKIGKLFGVSHRCISNIILGRTWNHVI